MEFLQMLFLSALIVLAGTVIFAVIQIIYILIEIRKSAEKANVIFDNAIKITESVSEPIEAVSSMLTGVKAGSILVGAVKVFNWLKKRKGKEEDGE